MAAFAIAGAVMSFVGSYQAYQDQRIGRKAQISQYGSSITTLEIDKEISALQRQRGRAAARTRTDLLSLDRDKLGVQIGLLEKETGFLERSAGIAREKLGLDERTLEAQRRGQRAEEAFAKGRLRVGLAESTAKARIETAQAKFVDSLGGATAFSRAFSQSSINELSTMEQQFKGLELRELISKETFESTLAKLGLGRDEIQLGLEKGLASIEAQQDIIGIQEKGIGIKIAGIETQEELAEEIEVQTQERIGEQQEELARQRGFVEEQQDDIHQKLLKKEKREAALGATGKGLF